MARYGLYSRVCRELFTFGGRVIVHHDRAQMEWLHPGTRVVEVPNDVPVDQTIPIQAHPDYATVAFDRDGNIAGKEQFRDPR